MEQAVSLRKAVRQAQAASGPLPPESTARSRCSAPSAPLRSDARTAHEAEAAEAERVGEAIGALGRRQSGCGSRLDRVAAVAAAHSSVSSSSRRCRVAGMGKRAATPLATPLAEGASDEPTARRLTAWACSNGRSVEAEPLEATALRDTPAWEVAASRLPALPCTRGKKRPKPGTATP